MIPAGRREGAAADLLSVPYSTGCSMIPWGLGLLERKSGAFSPLFYGVFNDTPLTVVAVGEDLTFQSPILRGVQ